MPTNLPKTTVKFLIALLKHQAKLWLGEDAAGIAAETILDEDIQTRLDDWLESDKTAKDLLNAVEKAQLYLQDPTNCPDQDLRHLFRDMTFGDLPTVQAAVLKIPQAMDSGKLYGVLHDAFQSDLPNLSSSQHAEGARLYTDAMLRAVGSLEEFVSPILLQTVLDLKKGQTVADKKLDQIIAFLEAKTVTERPPSPTQKGDLPIGSHLPFPRNRNFTGRVEDLRKLKDALLTDQPGIIINQAVTGMGGIGKTQLAVEFAYEYGHLFKGVHWLDLRDPQALTSQIALCGSKMGLPNWPEKLPEQVMLTLHEWKSEIPRLLILDNFEELEAANDVLANLQHSGLRLLITSRRTDWSTALGLRRLPLDEFSPEESREFLHKYLPADRESDAELDSLANHLGHLPLALELAGRYLEKHPRLKIRDYLAQLEKALEHKSMQNWKPEQKSLTGHDLSLLKTFALSWEQVKDENAQRLFIACGYCAPNTQIPASILDAASGEGSEFCDECITELTGLGLLKEGPSTHPLLAQFARRLDVESAVLVQFSDAAGDLAAKTNKEEIRTGNYQLFLPILSHVRELAQHADLLEKPSGLLWNELGYHVNQSADYAGAKAAFERALKIDEATYGPDHPTVAIRVNNLGSVLKDLGDLTGAKAAFERALKIDEATYGPDHPTVAIRVNNLGLVLQDLGDLTGAKAAYERAIKIWEASLGTEHPQVATGVNNLGLVLQDLGDLTGAKAAYARAIKIWEASLGTEHPQVATSVNNLGSVLKDLGDLTGAKAAFERALKIFEKQLGEDHPNVATLVNNLGSVLKDLGDLAGAKAAYERSLKIDEVAYGPDHPDVAIDVNNLGLVLKDQGDLAGAKAAYERTLKILEKFLPPDHPNIKIVRGNLKGL